MNIRMKKDDVFHIAKSFCAHTCDSVSATVKKAWLRNRISEKMAQRQSVTVPELSDWFRLSFGLDVERSVLERCTRQVRNMFLAENASFGIVNSFLESLAKANPGTTFNYQSLNGQFLRAFLCPSICVPAFHNSTKVIGLDACHIRARYGGVILLVTVLDGNGSLFSAAIGIAESEKEDTWKWFLLLLRNALHIDNEGEGIVAMSDREKGIDNALKEILPRASHAFCVFHIMKNVKKHHHTALDGLLFKAAKASHIDDYNAFMNQIRSLHEAAWEYIKGTSPEKWARALFGVRRFGHVTSNMAESMNKWLGEARYLDPVGLFRAYIRKLNCMFEKRDDMYNSMQDDDLPKRVAQMIKTGMEDGEKLTITQHRRLIFEVQRKTRPTTTRVVNLNQMSCSCGFYEEFGVPCRHMCKASTHVNIHPKELVIPVRRVGALKRIYQGVFLPIDINHLQDDGTKAPTMTKKRGRPREKRIPSSAEKTKKRTVKCGKCGQLGHNSRTCTKQSKA